MFALGPAVSSAAAQVAEPQTNLPDIEDEVMCPVCGTTLELAEAPQAEREREQIRGLIEQGLSKEQIKDELVAEYGDEVLAEPQSSGFDLAAWVVPLLGALLALIAICTWVLRGRRRAGGAAPPAPLSEEDRTRLDAELTSFDR
ncbi:MAG: cytochrome c-type biogenesis protein CcmH [Actinomycetota bacterium]|nr:cytochrome c-type biogenesis protein CcmH [Actinomycetota bacterium]